MKINDGVSCFKHVDANVSNRSIYAVHSNYYLGPGKLIKGGIAKILYRGYAPRNFDF